MLYYFKNFTQYVLFYTVAFLLCSITSSAQDSDFPIFSDFSFVNPNYENGLGLDDNMSIASDKRGHWMMTWSSKEEIDGPSVAYYATSKDLGSTWTVPLVIGDAGAGEEFLNTLLLSDEHGTWVSIWEVTGNGHPELGSYLKVYATISHDFGRTWSSLKTIGIVENSFRTDTQIATDYQGNWVVTIFTWENSTSDIVLLTCNSQDNAQTWSNEEMYITNSEIPFYINSELSTDNDGNWMLMYTTPTTILIDDDGFFYYLNLPTTYIMSSSDTGEDWSTPTLFIDFVEVQNESPIWEYTHIQYLDYIDSTWVAVGVFNRNEIGVSHSINIVLFCSTDNGATWSEDVLITSELENNGDFNNVETDGNGNWVMIFSKRADDLAPIVDSRAPIFLPFYNLLMMTSTDDGKTWSPLEQYGISRSRSGPLVSDGNGNWMTGQVDIKIEPLPPFPPPPNPEKLVQNVTQATMTFGESERGGGSSNNLPCFIATAAYGTPLAQEIDVLRNIRDEHLLTNAIGSSFVDSYYRLSPPIADVVASQPLLKSIVQVLLMGLIWMVHFPYLVIGALLMLGIRQRFNVHKNPLS